MVLYYLSRGVDPFFVSLSRFIFAPLAFFNSVYYDYLTLPLLPKKGACVTPALCEQLVRHPRTGDLNIQRTVVGVGEEHAIGSYTIHGTADGFLVTHASRGPIESVAYDDVDHHESMDTIRYIVVESGTVYIRAVCKG
jgi:hypothetical protein